MFKDQNLAGKLFKFAGKSEKRVTPTLANSKAIDRIWVTLIKLLIEL